MNDEELVELGKHVHWYLQDVERLWRSMKPDARRLLRELERRGKTREHDAIEVRLDRIGLDLSGALVEVSEAFEDERRAESAKATGGGGAKVKRSAKPKRRR